MILGIDRLTTTAAASIGVAITVMAIKYWAYLLTGSVALYSDALESIVNVTTGIAALIAVRYSAKPADRTHPFGHHKAEYFSAVVEGVLIVLAAILILREVWLTWQQPKALETPGLGMLASAVATVINGAWAWFLISRGRSWRSPALVADGKHLMTDVVSSVGVLVGLGLVLATGWLILDPLIAALVAVHILREGWRVVTDSLSGLMDRSADRELLMQIRGIISGSAEGAVEVHDLKTRIAGRATFIEFHLVVPGTMAVRAAHDICDRIEAGLRASIQDARILIHVEPEDKAKQDGVLVL